MTHTTGNSVTIFAIVLRWKNPVHLVRVCGGGGVVILFADFISMLNFLRFESKRIKLWAICPEAVVIVNVSKFNSELM